MSRTSAARRADGPGSPLAGFTAAGGWPGDGHRLGQAGQTLTEHLGRLGAEVQDLGAVPTAGGVRGRLAGPGADVELAVHGWAGSAAWPFAETLIQADCGIMAVHGRSEADPRPLGVGYASVLAGIAAGQGLLAAVLARLRGLPVSRVELSVAGIALLAVTQYIAAATAVEDPEGEIGPSTARPPFAAADGVLFELEAFDSEAWRRFWTELGAAEADIRRGWRPFLLRYERASVSLPPGLHDATRSRRFDDIAAIAVRTGISLCRVRSLAERRADPDLGSAPWVFTAAGAPAPPGPRPALPADSLPLAGIRVVESTRRVQGPMASWLLQLLGAEVVRIEPPGGDPMRGIPPMAGDCAAKFTALNAGKQIVELDLKGASGRDGVRELIRDSDVFIHNWAPGKARELGLDADDLHAVNPALSYAYASGWGDALGSAPPAGTDYMVQAHAGVADALSVAGRPARPTLMILLDVIGGFVSAEGILAALVARHRGGGGSQVGTSLLSAAATLLAGRLRGQPRTELIDAVFPTAEGRLAVVADGTEIQTLARLTQLPPGALAEPDKLSAALAESLAARPAAEWEHLLGAGLVPAVVVREDLSTLPAGRRYAGAFTHHGCAVVTSPWRFA